jgi:pimeloyl-ACP methyl ester carboxylesterase
MEYFVGAALALVVAIGATCIGLDRGRSFYPTVLVVVASYYDLFAVMGGSVDALTKESLVMVGFIAVAMIGFRTNLWIVVAALAAHGMLDIIHSHLVSNPGVPRWWPMFCMTYDVAAAGYLGWLLLRPGKSGLRARPRKAENSACAMGLSPRATGFGHRIRPFIDDEFRASSISERAGDLRASFRHLERAHILGQTSTIEHVRVHVRMLIWGVRQRDIHECAAQMLRIVGAATKTALKLIPQGNTGGSNVGAFRSMPVPSDLADIITAASRRAPSRFFAPVIILFALVVAGGSSAAPTDVLIATVGGRNISYKVLGSGRPVIVMMSGLGDGMASFERVAPELAKGATVIIYDRAGYGGSTNAVGPADAAAVSRDLSAMLIQSGVSGPYVLIGHSLGGLFAEFFAAQYPDQVAGLVLAESRAADFSRRCEASKAWPCKPPKWVVNFMAQGAQSEFASLPSTIEEVEATKPESGKAVLILSRPVGKSRLDRVWGEAQNDLARRYPGARHLNAPAGGHDLHRDQAPWFIATVLEYMASWGVHVADRE